MPSQTFHVRTEDITYLDKEADRRGLENPSQALKQILDEVRNDG